MGSDLPYRRFPFRHRLITWFINQDRKGFRFLAARLPRWIMPNPEKQGPMILETLHNISLHIDPSIDKGVELSLFQSGSYEYGILDFIKRHYTGKGSFVDVGANIGLMSLYLARHFPEAEVHAFEAHPETVELLRENCRVNHLERIEIHPHALGNEASTVVIYDNWQVNRGGATLVSQEGEEKGYSVEMRRLDDCEVEQPEMVKIDVEGVELEVLKGAEVTLRKYRPILIIEVSDERENAHGSSQEIVDFVRSLGAYTIFKLQGGKERRSKLIEVTTSEDIPSHDNILCIPR